MAELDEPVQALRPGLERMGRVLDDPMFDSLGESLRRLLDDLLPLVGGLHRTQVRVASIAAGRLMSSHGLALLDGVGEGSRTAAAR